MEDKKKMAYDLFIESVIEPNHELRTTAKKLECFMELMQIRADMLEYLYKTRSNYGSFE